MTGLWIVVDSWLTFAAVSHEDKNSEANRMMTMLKAMFWVIVSFKSKCLELEIDLEIAIAMTDVRIECQ